VHGSALARFFAKFWAGLSRRHGALPVKKTVKSTNFLFRFRRFEIQVWIGAACSPSFVGSIF
jgi:hypothetical protein